MSDTDDTPERKEWRATFLETLAQTGNVRLSAEIAGVGFKTAYRHRADDSDFRAAWSKALLDSSDILEQEARRRAVEGVDEPVFYKGEICGTVRKYSDTLLIFLLKGNNPDKFKERVEQSGDPDRPVMPSNPFGNVTDKQDIVTLRGILERAGSSSTSTAATETP